MLFRIVVEETKVVDGLVDKVDAICNFLGTSDVSIGLRDMMCELLEAVRGINKQEGHGDTVDEDSVSFFC